MPSWKIEEPPDIRKIFKKLGSNEKIQYISAIKTLATSEDPKIHGQYKQTKGCYSYRLTSSFRILYDINYKEKRIDIISIGDHKKTYGED